MVGGTFSSGLFFVLLLLAAPTLADPTAPVGARRPGYAWVGKTRRYSQGDDTACFCCPARQASPFEFDGMRIFMMVRSSK